MKNLLKKINIYKEISFKLNITKMWISEQIRKTILSSYIAIYTKKSMHYISNLDTYVTVFFLWTF